MTMTKFETTAKELAFKAYCDGIKGKDTRYDVIETDELIQLNERFNAWWKKNFHEKFYEKNSVIINSNKYIIAE